MPRQGRRMCFEEESCDSAKIWAIFRRIEVVLDGGIFAQRYVSFSRSCCHRWVVLPELTAEGELPAGVHTAGWQEFQSRFCSSSPRRIWLSNRLLTLVQLAATSRKLQRIIIWGSFVTAKPAPKDVDVLLIMDEDFEVDQVAAPVQEIFNSVRAKLLFDSDVFWARTSIGREVLDLWLETYQVSRTFRKRVLWNWSCHDPDRRTNAARAAMRGQSTKNPNGGA